MCCLSSCKFCGICTRTQASNVGHNNHAPYSPDNDFEVRLVFYNPLFLRLLTVILTLYWFCGSIVLPGFQELCEIKRGLRFEIFIFIAQIFVDVSGTTQNVTVVDVRFCIVLLTSVVLRRKEQNHVCQ